SVQFTPPFSLFDDKDYTDLPDSEKYRWIEYHKWKFNAYWYTPLTKNKKLVLSTRANFGFLGSYNDEIGQSPFERFYLGGDGLSGFSLDGREIIALRGYENNSITPRSRNGYIGGTVYDKFTFEMRYLVSPNPNALVYGLAFLEGGNNWLNFKEFSPFSIKRSAGFGVRIFLPMFGMLGLDYGYGIDEIFNAPGSNKGNFHFSIGQQF
ncbi:MAG: BamA/TamA family outer membrane protein, partial [Bacteroidia bacterium]|nr:BamA/TamA family outer membrane protein [Bacteroidia bacterium]